VQLQQDLPASVTTALSKGIKKLSVGRKKKIKISALKAKR
jgi:hypothetical protein